MSVGSSLTLSGAYAMLSVPLTPCLQQLSDSLVTILAPHVTETAKKAVPSWVYDLPPAEQELKIAYVHQYGSPNVFEGFAPHVTLAYDDAPSDLDDGGGVPADSIYGGAVGDVAESWELVNTEVLSVGFGFVGPAGTVKRGPVVLESISILYTDEVGSI